jgi:hypothetical protein
MQADITNKTNGRIAMELDREAAQTLFASMVFVSKYHEGIQPLALIVEQNFEGTKVPEQRN